MPPKKFKGKDPKGKKGKKDDPKGKKGKEDKKGKGGLGGPIYDNVALISLDREELERAGHKITDELRLVRSERVRFQLERDFLYDISESYMLRYKNQKKMFDMRALENLKALQDKDEVKIIKGIKAKHFRYEIQLKATQMDLREEMRRRKLKDDLERVWQQICMDTEAQDDKLNEVVAKTEQEMTEALENTNDLDKHAEDQREQLENFRKDLEDKIAETLENMLLMSEIDRQQGEDKLRQFVNELAKGFEKDFNKIKNYYIDITHNNLNLIIMMKKKSSELYSQNKIKKRSIAALKEEIAKMRKSYNEIMDNYAKANLKNSQSKRLESKVKSMELSLGKSTQKLKVYITKNKEFIHALIDVEEDRDFYKAYQFDQGLLPPTQKQRDEWNQKPQVCYY